MKITAIRRFGWLLFLQFVAVLALSCSRTELVPADKSGLSEIGAVSERIDAQVKELNQLFDNYVDLAYDTENVIQGLNKLGLHYSGLTTSLMKTKSLIEEITKEHSKLREENEGLHKLAQIDKDQLDQYLKYQEERTKWSNRLEAFMVNLVAGIVVGIIGTVIFQNYTKFKQKKRKESV